MAVQNIFLVGPRTCGKSTVGRTLSEILVRWHFVDLDAEYQRRFPAVGERAAHNSKEYYEGSLDILNSLLDRERTVVALGGGTLINSTLAPDGCDTTVSACKKHGKFALLLPSRMDFINRRTLLSREMQRDYARVKDPGQRKKLQQFFCDQYSERISFYRKTADTVIYGADPETSARTIIKRFQLKS